MGGEATVRTESGAFLADVLEGLCGGSRKSLPCKYFYDTEGSRLFERICELDEYYLTRTEVSMMRESAAEMAGLIGPACLLLEFGSGAGVKTRILLDHLEAPAGYVPIDISEEMLHSTAAALGADYPGLAVMPVCGDYTEEVELPPCPPAARRIVYFPGSTVGNFRPPEAVEFLERVARLVGPGGGLLIGVDLKKDPAALERAYDDAEGVTAAFNLNLLVRINRELGADFDLDQWAHRALYDQEEGRIAMYLVSERRQTVTIAGEAVEFAAGEEILTEHSYKYAAEEFAALLERAGLAVRRTFTDPRELFCVLWATRGPESPSRGLAD